jgi:hypothetical protein
VLQVSEFPPNEWHVKSTSEDNHLSVLPRVTEWSSHVDTTDFLLKYRIRVAGSELGIFSGPSDVEHPIVCHGLLL